jgi:hypothetical protein
MENLWIGRLRKNLEVFHLFPVIFWNFSKVSKMEEMITVLIINLYGWWLSFPVGWLPSRIDDIELKLKIMSCYGRLSWYVGWHLSTADVIHLLWTIFIYGSWFKTQQDDVHPRGTDIIHDGWLHELIIDHWGWKSTTEDDKWLTYMIHHLI